MFGLWQKLGWAGKKANTGKMTMRRPAARLEVEVLENRLVPSAFGVPDDFLDPASPAVQFKLNAAGDAVKTGSITNNETDLFTFVAPVSGTYRVAATTPFSNLDTVLGVYDSAGQLIDFNDDISATNRDSQVFVNLTAGERFVLSVTNFTGTSGGSYTLVVDGTRGDDLFENNDSRSTASNLGTLTEPRTIPDLVLADSADFYKFTIGRAGTAADHVRILFSHALGDLDMSLFNAAGTRLRTSAGVTDSEMISLNGLPAGIYTLRVIGFNGAKNPHYNLELNFGASEPAPAPEPTPTPAPGSFQIDLTFSGLTSTQIAAFQAAADRWEQIIVGDLPDVTFNGQVIDDIRISAVATPIDGINGTLGQAGPTNLRSGSALPFRGSMEFDSADMAAMEANGTLQEVIMHEMGHVLGIGTIWSTLGLLAGAGTSNSRFLGAQATAEFNALFGQNAAGVPLEFQMGPGSNDSHWRESLFGNELMSPAIGSAGNPISRITVASLADLGYTVNLAAADPYTPPGFTSVVSTSSSSGGSGTSLVRSSYRHLDQSLNAVNQGPQVDLSRGLVNDEQPVRMQSPHQDHLQVTPRASLPRVERVETLELTSDPAPAHAASEPVASPLALTALDTFFAGFAGQEFAL